MSGCWELLDHWKGRYLVLLGFSSSRPLSKESETTYWWPTPAWGADASTAFHRMLVAKEIGVGSIDCKTGRARRG